MQNITRAHDEPFTPTPDERFSSVTDLWEYSQKLKERSMIKWTPTADINIGPVGHSLSLALRCEIFISNLSLTTHICVSKRATVRKYSKSRNNDMPNTGVSRHSQFC